MKQSLIIIMIFSLILFIHKPTNAQDAGTAKLLENVGSETVWKCRSSAVKIISGNSGLYSNLIRVGMGILAIAALLQIINKTIQHFGSGQINSERPYMYIFEWLISLLLFAFLCSGPVYGVLVRDVIAGIPDLISQLILDSFYEEMYSSLVDLFKSEKEGILSSSWHFLTMTISGGTTQAIMSGVMYLITKTLLFIFPMVQKMVFAVVVIMGPICLPFGMCDWTRRIAFMVRYGSYSLYVGNSWKLVFWAWHTFEIQKYLIIGNTSNFFLAVAFGIGSIILFLSSFMISGSIFSGLSSVGILTSGALISSMANSVYKANGMLSNGSSEKSGSSDNLGSGFSSKKTGKVSESDTGGTLVSNTPGNIG